jgi:hypothetical protein
MCKRMCASHDHKLYMEDGTNGALFRDVANENLKKLRRMVTDNLPTDSRSCLFRTSHLGTTHIEEESEDESA